MSALPIAIASPEPPLKPGEQLRFSVSWAIVPGAGEITVGATTTPDGQLKITTTTATRRLARLLLPFDASADSFYDAKTGRLMSLYERSNTRSKHEEHTVSFNHEKHEAVYTTVGSTTSRILPMPEGSPNDLITALFETRFWNLKPGESHDALVLFNDDFYQLTIHALRYEDVSTSLGRFRTLVLEPRMEKTPPKGMFKKGSTVQVWISQDERRLPVKFEVEFNIGTGTATLKSYTPPSAPADEQTAAHPGTPPSSGPVKRADDAAVSGNEPGGQRQ